MTVDELVSKCGIPREHPLDEVEVDAFEQSIGHTLPAGYREFLFRCEGLMPDARFIVADVYPDHIFGLCDDEDFSLKVAMAKFGSDVPSAWVVIADGQWTHLICMQLEGEARGSVWRFDGETKEMRRIADSFEAFVALLEPPPPQAVDFHLAARVHFDAGRFTEASEGFQYAWSQQKHAHTAYWLSQSLISLGQIEEARMWLDTAYEMAPEHSMIATKYAAAMHEQGRDEEAVRVLQETLGRVPTYGPARKLLAMIESNR